MLEGRQDDVLVVVLVKDRNAYVNKALFSHHAARRLRS
jgi:hypothetical protein